MSESTTERTLIVRVGVGFVLMLVLMATIVTIGMLRLNAVKQDMRQIVVFDSRINELAFRMKEALRERAILMHKLALLRDRFEQEDIFLRYTRHGTHFIQARDQFMALATDEESRAALEAMRKHTSVAQPLAAEAVTMAMSGRQAAALQLISQRVTQAQDGILREITNLQAIQQRRLEKSILTAEEEDRRTRFWIIVLGGITGVFGAGIAGFVIQTTRRQAQQLQHQALYDALTGLPNRSLFSDRLELMIRLATREQLTFSLMLIDLDQFKSINDTLGHAAGDEVLRQASKRWAQCLRESDTIARMGGDEFAALLPTATTREGAIEVARRLLDTMESPLDVGSQKIQVGLSIGIAMFPEHSTEAQSLLRRSDSAMYIAKRAQEGYRLFSEDLVSGEDSRLLMQNELRRAIERNEFTLHYQPKIDFDKGRVTGVEALVRWQHPERGIIMPDMFIPLAERSGLIKLLTRLVLDMAIRQCRQWQDSGAEMSVAVNVSTINVQDPEFPSQIRELLTQHHLPARLLELEMTESAVMTDSARAIECIRTLADAGVQISIDDFGTGYSSMTNLKDLMVAKIKIDRTFVREMTSRHSDEVIVRSTIELGHNLGLKVVAEGVEDQAAWNRLRDLGCDSAQGYYMSKPLPPEALIDWMAKSPWGVPLPR